MAKANTVNALRLENTLIFKPQHKSTRTTFF